jgi:hypothetical protein
MTLPNATGNTKLSERSLLSSLDMSLTTKKQLSSGRRLPTWLTRFPQPAVSKIVFSDCSKTSSAEFLDCKRNIFCIFNVLQMRSYQKEVCVEGIQRSKLRPRVNDHFDPGWAEVLQVVVGHVNGQTVNRSNVWRHEVRLVDLGGKIVHHFPCAIVF